MEHGESLQQKLEADGARVYFFSKEKQENPGISEVLLCFVAVHTLGDRSRELHGLGLA